MALFKFQGQKQFRVRSPRRDRETDAARAARLLTLVDGLRKEIERERDGLRNRHESIAFQAAFSQQALEDDEATSMSPAINDLTEMMIRYMERITALEKQIDFVTGLRAQAELFPLENEEVAAPSTDKGRRLA